MRLFALSLLGLLVAGTALGQGDPEAGAERARMCQACHAFGEGAANKIGPVLNGVVGRVAGTFEGFAYSPAMVEKGEEGLVWTPATLDAFLASPKAFVPFTKMTFVGVRDQVDRDNLIAFLLTLSPDYQPIEVPVGNGKDKEAAAAP